MSTMLEKVLNRIRGKRFEEKASIEDQFIEEVVVPLAQDKEVDADHVDDFMTALAIDEPELRLQVKTKKGRFSDSELYGKAVSARLAAAKLEPEIEKLVAERDRQWAEMNQKIAPKQEKLRELQNEAMPESGYRANLIHTVMNSKLRAELAKINDEERSLNLRRNELMESGIPKQFRYYENAVESFESQVAKMRADHFSETHFEFRQLRENLTQARKTLESYRPRFDAHKKEFSQVEKALGELHPRREKLHEQCLIP